MSIKISVVIPTFKRPQLLIKCLTALNEQCFSRDEYEVIIVTDGPDDDTRNEVFSFAKKNFLLNLFCTSLLQKAGPAAARNKGAGLAKGELIAFTDDDCIPQTDWLKNFWNACHESRKEYVAFTGKTIVPQSDKPTDYEKNISNLETAEFITANCACTNAAFKKVSGFDEEFPLAWREDSDFQFKLIAASIPIIKVEDAVIIHPVRTAPWGVSLKEQKKSVYNALLYKKNPLLYKQRIGAKPLFNYYIIVMLLPLIVICYINKWPVLVAVSTLWWILLVTQFTIKRLKGTSKKASHVLEMIITSILIPFLSVFWNLYGSLRYKKFSL